MKKIERKYHVFDAKEEAFGRLATRIATVLRGKNKRDFTPNIDGGDFAVVINSDGLKASGKKMENKFYIRFSGYPGGIKKSSLKEKMEEDSRKIIKEAVYGMLPKNKLRNFMMKRLLVFKDENHGLRIS